MTPALRHTHPEHAAARVPGLLAIADAERSVRTAVRALMAIEHGSGT